MDKNVKYHIRYFIQKKKKKMSQQVTIRYLKKYFSNICKQTFQRFKIYSSQDANNKFVHFDSWFHRTNKEKERNDN